MNLDFYYSKEQNNLIVVLNSSKEINIDGYEKLIPNTVDAAHEKHVPVVNVEDDGMLFIQVGEVSHPMTEEHLISAIYVVTDNGDMYKKVLTKDDMPEFSVDISSAKEVKVYAYCNLHGVWMTKVEL